MIDACVVSKPKPAVYISGGLDSAILLHHLTLKATEQIYTYTFGFPSDHEFEYAKKIASYYHICHRHILVENMLDKYPEILKHFPFPRFNLWVWWLAEQAKKDGRETAYAGEGADEHFGGYWNKRDRSYLQSWADHFEYIKPTYEIVHRVFRLNLEMPFTKLDFHKTLRYWDSKQEKTLLREAYKGIIPDFVRERKKVAGGANYLLFWEKELHKHYPQPNPHGKDVTRALVRRLWQLHATKVWLEQQLKK